MPTIIQKPSPNFWQGRDGQEAVAICYHGTGSPQNPLNPGLEDIDQVFSNPDYDASTHFAISRTGEIHQYVDTKNAAWGNGPMNSPDMSIPWIADCFKNNINPNLRTISIETKNDSSNSQALTEPQYQSLLWLSRKLLAENPKIKADRNGMIGHFQLDKKNRARCPGPNFPMERLMKDLAQPIPDPSVWVAPTGFEMNSEYGFYPYWKANGGLAIFGYPISGAFYDVGRGAIVQWTERARFENHAKSSKVEDVQLGLVGKELLAKG
jgi:N-acetyl-anhydromuramyl-L-alanine amidase AmpD